MRTLVPSDDEKRALDNGTFDITMETMDAVLNGENLCALFWAYACCGG